jgi:hypothetical protein
MSLDYKNVTRSINRGDTFSLAQKRIMRQLVQAIDEGLDLIADFTDVNYESNQLLEGGAVWLQDLDFLVTPCTFVIDGKIYKSLETTVTLGTADATHPRIDVIVVNKDGTVEVVAGTAAADPVKPEIDADEQVEVTFVTVASGATAPSSVANTDIYKEDTEWTSSVVGNVAADDTTDPYAGTKAIAFSQADNGDRVLLTSSGTVNPADMDSLLFRIKNVSYGDSSRNRIRMAWYYNDTRVSNWVDLRHGSYGFDGRNTAEYQTIAIPVGNFIPDGSTINRLRIQVAAATGQTLSFYLDNIQYQTGVTAVDTSDYARLSRNNVYKKAQGSSITTLTDGATVSWNMNTSNVYSLTLGGNRTIAAPTDVRPGYTYILLLKQDATGSRTVTWNAVFKWAGATAPTLTTTANGVDVLTFVADESGNLHGSLGIAESS